MPRLLAAVLTSLVVAGCGTAPTPAPVATPVPTSTARPESLAPPASAPPIAAATSPASAAAAASTSEAFYPDGIPWVVGGEPVARPSEAETLAATSAPFLVGGWTHFIGMSCPSAGPPYGASRSPDAVAAVDLLAPSCRSQIAIGETFQDATLFMNLSIPDDVSLPWQGAVVVRLHAHDPRAALCPDALRVSCDAALVVDDVVWRLDGVPEPTDRPVPSAVAPFVLRVDGVDHTIRSVADCARLQPTTWLGAFCSLLLRPRWPDILVDYADPMSDPFWAAATARAQIDGDLSICTDVRTREWGLPLANGGSDPHPVAGCGHQIADPRTPGVIRVNDPTNLPKKPTVEVRYRPPKVALPAPPLSDPFVRCPFGGPAFLGASACGRIVDAILAEPGVAPGSLASIDVDAALVPCAHPSDCAPPAGAQLLGSATITLEDASTRAVNAWDVAGRTVLRNP
jgi:hypothetical protein